MNEKGSATVVVSETVSERALAVAEVSFPAVWTGLTAGRFDAPSLKPPGWAQKLCSQSAHVYPVSGFANDLLHQKSMIETSLRLPQEHFCGRDLTIDRARLRHRSIGTDRQQSPGQC